MSRATIIIAIAVVLLAGAGVYAYFSHEGFREGIDAFVKSDIIGEESRIDSVIRSAPAWIYLVADPTDIDDREFAIPKVDTTFIRRMLDWMFDAGGGRFWLTYIDNRSQDNEVKYWPVPARQSVPAPPVARSGETSFAFAQRKHAYDEQRPEWVAESVKIVDEFINARRALLEECQSFLSRQVYVSGSPNHRSSDVIGTLNAGIRSLVSGPSMERCGKYIVAFSDLVHNVKGSSPLSSIPSDVTIISVNPMPGSSNKVTDSVLEVEHPLRAFELISESTGRR